MSDGPASALRSPRLQLVLRVLLGLYFVHASLDKIADPPAFARIVYQWQVLGPIPSNIVAVTLPWVELLAGLLLIVGIWKRDAAAVVAVMLGVFLVAAGLVLAQGIDVENCGCTSVAASAASWLPPWMQGVGWYLVTRNLLMLGAALVLAFVQPRPPETETEGVRSCI
ncbi:MAG: MauE/DoxX family redox-associated membrane protein [Vicinamibacteria bacterium]